MTLSMEVMGSSTQNTSRLGIARVDGNAARVAGASTGGASDQGKAATGSGERLGETSEFQFSRIHQSATETATPLGSKSRRGDHEIDPRFQNRKRQPGLDFLRALAIIVVVVYHAALFGFKLPGRVDRFGWIGVDLFFVLSGYLIGGQLLAPLARDQRINLGQFFTRRALRIMPAYFAILAIYFLLPSWREYAEMSSLWKFVLSMQNIGLHGGTAFSHAFSLAVHA